VGAWLFTNGRRRRAATARARQGVAQRLGALDGTRGAVEGREPPIARLFHESPAEPLDGSARDVVVPIEERAPAPVTDLGRPLGGVDDVGEKDGRQDAFAHHWMTDARDELDYRVEDRLMVLGVPAAMDVTRELDVAGVVDVRAEISPESRGHEVVAGRVDDQCRHCRVPSLSTSFSSILEIRRTRHRWETSSLQRVTRASCEPRCPR
jgi:hypothetical protein